MGDEREYRFCDVNRQHLDDGGARISGRRHLRNALMASWIARRTPAQLAQHSNRSVPGGNALNEAHSVRYLVQRHGDKRIIENPREYQVELFQRAKEHNILAVLDTGMGKTLVSVLLIRWMIEQELEHQSNGGRSRIVFFLVANVALALQQHSVLQCNLPYKVGKLYGECVQSGTKEEWKSLVADNMAMVCTAEVLYQSLTHAFITMSDINLLVFDEAHHAKKDHVFARVMKDYYHESPLMQRPKVFGMTASPVGAKGDIAKAGQALAKLLDSKIATVQVDSMSRPQEICLKYTKTAKLEPTSLTKSLVSCFCGDKFFDGFLRNAESFTSELGEWCGDHYWKQCFVDGPHPPMEYYCHRQVEMTAARHSTARLSVLMTLIKEGRNVVAEHDFAGPNSSLNLTKPHILSSKVRVLMQFLNHEYEKPTSSKCIVFVNHRQKVSLLVELFRLIGPPNLKCAGMLGIRNAEVGDTSCTLKDQINILSKFETGETNCLFATSVAEEGLDIVKCNIVIRFDLCTTMIQYLQSRGRARHRDSRFIHMLELDNSTHENLVARTQAEEIEMRRFIKDLPLECQLSSAESVLERSWKDENECPTYTEPETGAVLNFNSSLTIFQQYIGRLPYDTEASPPQPTYVIFQSSGNFVCELIPPEQAGLKSVIGDPFSTKARARRSAAFKACIQLRKLGLLNERFLPASEKPAKARDVAFALEEEKKKFYAVRSKPDCWKTSWGQLPETLFVTLFDMDKPMACGRIHQPLAFLTRQKLVEIPPFTLWTQPGVSATVIGTQGLESIQFSRKQLQDLTKFTLLVFKDVFNKEYELSDVMMSYWLAPVLPFGARDWTGENVISLDWPCIERALSDIAATWTPEMPPLSLVDRYVVDPGDGSRRFFTDAIEHNLHPLDPPPKDVAPFRPKHMATILAYSNSKWGKARSQIIPDLGQPVLRAFMPTPRRNFLAPWSEEEARKRTLAYICPQNLRFSRLPTAFVVMIYNLPTIISRMEAYLVANDACRLLDLDIAPSLALEALTKNPDGHEEDRSQQAAEDRGECPDYERLEFIGDCFLKMATSISLFVKYRDDDEYAFHVKRMLMICNANLYKNATAIKLYEYIRTAGFNRRSWYPHGLKLLRGKGMTAIEQAPMIALSDKTIADVCEAFIGAALLSGAEPGNMDMAVKAVTKMVQSKDHQMQKWDDYCELYKTSMDPNPSSVTAVQLELSRIIFESHPYKFKDAGILQSAFTHPSYPYSWAGCSNYQRLEFLGDSLLDLAAVNFLYKRHPGKGPQWLTEHKMAMVSNKFLACVCVSLNFHQHLRHHSDSLPGQITFYHNEITELKRENFGKFDYWTRVDKDPPKSLADVVEAYLGALFIDSGFSFDEIERFFDAHIAPHFQDMLIYDTFANDHPITALSTLLMNTYGCRDVEVWAEEVPSHIGGHVKTCSVVFIHDEIVADAWSSSTKYGRLRAASEAKKQIEKLSLAQFREKFNCDCELDIEMQGNKNADLHSERNRKAI